MATHGTQPLEIFEAMDVVGVRNEFWGVISDVMDVKSVPEYPGDYPDKLLRTLQRRLKVVPEYPGDYPDKLLRTLQRRLKVWRSQQADALLFGTLNKELPIREIARPH
ncbi:hypothetical protein BMJ30_23975 [Sinorhizobium medicae]|nr:hypothetical protein [Sinorhizobium medicae]PLU14089.1 hypothetical protein BMJ30_23975 [Sinorhizobium medicae]